MFLDSAWGGHGATAQAHLTPQQYVLQARGEQLNATDKKAGGKADPAVAFHPRLLTFPAPLLLFVNGNAYTVLTRRNRPRALHAFP